VALPIVHCHADFRAPMYVGGCCSDPPFTQTD
jgi:hypothetical protein